MNDKELKKQYDELLSEIENNNIYDGRSEGVDVYICEKCKAEFYTRYKDKGVTPFVIRCRKDGCNGSMTHRDTISNGIAFAIGAEVHNWVRPSFEQLKELDLGTQEHVLNGGLILEDELKKDEAEVKQIFDKVQQQLDSLQNSDATYLFIGDQGNHFVISGNPVHIIAQIVFAMCHYPVVKRIITTCATRFDQLNAEVGDDIRNVTMDHLIEQNSGN